MGWCLKSELIIKIKTQVVEEFVNGVKKFCDKVDDALGFNSDGEDDSKKKKSSSKQKEDEKASKKDEAPGEDASKRGSNDAKFTNKQAKENAKKNGYKDTGQKGGPSGKSTICYKKKGDPKYIVKSETSHNGDAWKGFRTISDAKQRSTKSTYIAVSYEENMRRIGK